MMMMSIVSVGLIIILLKIACVSIRADDDAKDPRAFNVDWPVKKEFKLILDEASWFEANKFCIDNGMQLASIDSSEEQQHIENLTKDKRKSVAGLKWFRGEYRNVPISGMVNRDEPFWISKSMSTVERNSGSMDSTSDSSSRCISWYWTNAELCCALWPLANEWSHEDCLEEKYFICQKTSKSEAEMSKVIQNELLTLLDEIMFTEFADALSTTAETAWISLVEAALQTWLAEQHQISKSATLLDEQVDSIAAEFAQSKKTFEADELRQFVNTKFEVIDTEHRVELLSERFRQFVGDLYVDLDGGSNRSGSPSDDDIVAVVKKIFMLAKVQEIKLAGEEMAEILERGPTDVLDEDFMKSISEQLLEFSEKEFESYVMDAFAQLEVYGVEQADMSTFYQLYLLVKQELISLISKTVLRATSQERIEITSYVLTRILEGKALIDENSVFGQIFVIIATGTTVLLEEKSVHILDDKILRTFVKQEFDGLQPEDLLQLKQEGYVKIVMDEVVKLVADINAVKTDSGELLLNDVIASIAAQFLLYVEDEMKVLAERMTQSIERESNKLHAIIEQTKISLSSYDEGNLIKIFALIEQELGKFVVQTLVNFTEKDRMELAEQGLTKILEESMPIGRSSIYAKALVALGDKLSTLSEENFAVMTDEQLTLLVQSELDEESYAKNIELFEEVYLSLIGEEFIKLIEDGAVMLAAHKEDSNQFGEMVSLIAAKLDIANDEPGY